MSLLPVENDLLHVGVVKSPRMFLTRWMVASTGACMGKAEAAVSCTGAIPMVLQVMQARIVDIGNVNSHAVRDGFNLKIILEHDMSVQDVAGSFIHLII